MAVIDAWTVPQIIGNNVKIRRERMGWSQAKLGKEIERHLATEWTRQQVYNAEKGGRSFTGTEIVGLALVLEVLPAALFQPPPATETLVVELAKGCRVPTSRVSGPTDIPDIAQQAIENTAQALAGFYQNYEQVRDIVAEMKTTAEVFALSLNQLAGTTVPPEAEGTTDAT